MKNLFFIILLSMAANITFGQQPTPGMRSYNQFDTAPNGFINSFAPAPEVKSTSVYLYDYWRTANIFLKDSTKLTNLNVKIDLKEDELDIQYNGTVKVLPFRKLLALSFTSGDGGAEIYINGASIFGSTHPYYDQLFQILREGEVSLYSKSYAQIIEASTNQALGLKIDEKVVVKKKYFIIYKQNFTAVGKKSDLKKELKGIFGEDVLPLLKKVNPKHEEDLLALVSELDSLTKQQ